MTMTIKQLLDFSWMSQASYLEFTGIAQSDRQALINKLLNSTISQGNIFAPSQAITLTDTANGFSFTGHKPNYLTGFSATVFQTNGASVR
jgi:hypothetical protein